MSVLFVDLEGFTAIAERLDPEAVRSLQEEYFAAAQSAVARYGGTLEKFIGDAVMAFWGAPTAYEDDALRAARAGLDIVAAAGTLRVGRRRLKARAAVATGVAVVTYDSSGLGMVTGDLVNTAARLQAGAPPGALLVDDATRRAVRGKLAFEPGGQAQLRGKRRLMDTWLVRAGDTPVVHDTGGVHRGPFVGRATELETLLHAYRTAAGDARSQLCVVIGIAGIGKSRLLWEFERRLATEPTAPLVLTAHTPAYGEGITFRPLSHVFSVLLGVGASRRSSLGRQVARALAGWAGDDAERDWLEPRLMALLQPADAPHFERADLFAAWRRYLEQTAAARPLVLVFEDVQWADPALLDFIENVASWARQRRLMIVVLARPELADSRPGWPTVTGAIEVRLGPLADEAMGDLLRALLPAAGRSVQARIASLAGGVPLYAVEVARMRGDGSADDTPLPETLHSLVAARIDSLPADQRRLLLTAAAIGQRFDAALLAALRAVDQESVKPDLDALVARQFLTCDPAATDVPPDDGAPTYAFVQQVVREVAYSTLSRRERRTLHLAAADQLEAATDEPPIEQIAEHLYHAYVAAPDHPSSAAITERALPLLRRAAARATALYAADRALTHFERALALASAQQRLELLPDAAAAARAAARFAKAEAWLRELIAHHSGVDEWRSAAHDRAQLASLMLATERHADALTDLESALAELGDLVGDSAGVELAGQLARGRMLIGDDEGGRAWAQRAVDGARRLGLTAVAVDALTTRGTARVHVGDVDGGLADLREAVAEAGRLGLPAAEIRARNNLAWQTVVDDPRATLEIARAGLDLAHRLGVTDMAVQLSEVVSAVALETGDWELAAQILDDVRDRPQATAHRVEFATTEIGLYAVRGEPTQARELAREILPLANRVDAQVAAGFERARALVDFLAGRLARAETRARAAARDLLWADEVAALALAGRAALWRADADGVRQSMGELVALGPRGRVGEASRMTLAAGAAALANDESAAERYAAAVGAWRELDLPLQLALCLIERGRLIGGATDEAAAILDDLRAEGLLALLRRMT